MNTPTAINSNQICASDDDISHYLRSTDIIDWQHPTVLEQAKRLADSASSSAQSGSLSFARNGDDGNKIDSDAIEGDEIDGDRQGAIAQACFEWVRDHIRHSFDYQLNPITYRASDVLKHRTGYCYAKSHLLAALLRANGIPTGFCYQRLSVDDTGAPYSLHGLNGIYLPNLLPEGDWYRVDPRGNKQGVNAQFCPPKEQLAFTLQFPEEADFIKVIPDPLPVVLECLKTHPTWDKVLVNLPDISLSEAAHIGLEAMTKTKGKS
ncbi:MAG: transglutaminase-like domain-containing protein [Cyanobacteria bacterium P01_F01_bin.150]